MKPRSRSEYDPDSSLDATAARPIYGIDDILFCQYRVLTHVVLRVYEIAEREAYFERKLDGAKGLKQDSRYQQHLETRRPSQVFYIDGTRGAGKTSLLITIKGVLALLGQGAGGGDTSVDGPAIKKLLTQIKDDLKIKAADTDARTPSPIQDEPLVQLYSDQLDFSVPHKVHANAPRNTAIGLAVLHPADLEEKQPILEGIFVQMRKHLNGRIEQLKSMVGQEAETKKLEKLKHDLIHKVAKGWHLSRQAGFDAILRDSVDYEDYLDKVADTGSASYDRVANWRHYVNDYLNALGTQILVIFLDDADNRPEVTLDLLNTMRIFLDHPRIVTVMAGNLRQTRQNLVLQEFGHLSEAMGALARAAPQTKRELRQLARRHTEELLEKVLPRPTRFFLDLDISAPKQLVQRTSEKERATGVVNATGYEKVLGCSFDQYCAAMLDVHRKKFLEARRKAHDNHRTGRNEIDGRHERSTLEDYMSWWLLRFWYDEWLAPRSMRHLLALRALTWTNPTSHGLSDRLPSFHEKRLPVILFESPENSQLLHRFSDHDSNVLRWLHRQQIASNWHGDRYFEINRAKNYSDTYPYRYLLYRIDLGLGLPIKENAEDAIPDGLLPKPAGPNLIEQTPLFPRIRQPDRTGVARQLRHSLVPANCYFMFGIQSLPDAHWEDAKQQHRDRPLFLGHRLILRWADYFHFEDADTDLDRVVFQLEKDDSERKKLRLRHSISVERRLRRYLIDIVIPMGCLHLGDFVRTARTINDDAPTFEKYSSNSLLSAEVGQKPGKEFYGDLADEIARAARRLEYFDTLDTVAVARSSLTAAAIGFGPWEDVLKKFLPVKEKTSPGAAFVQNPDHLEDSIRGYRWLINDIRASYAAIRIFHAEIDAPLCLLNEQLAGSEVQNRSRKSQFARYRKYTVISRETLDRWLGKGNFGQCLHGVLEDWQKVPAPTAQPDAEAYRDQIFRVMAQKRSASSDKKDLRRSREISISTLLRDELGALLKATGCSRMPDLNALTDGKEWTKRALTQEEIEHLVLHTRQSRLVSGNYADWPLLFDPSVTPRSSDPSEAFDNTNTTAAMKNRIARSYFCLLGALAPNLPTAIHIEIASCLYDCTAGKNNRSEYAALADEGLENWRSRILAFMLYLLRYRAVLEIDRLKLDVIARLEACQKTDDEADRAKPVATVETIKRRNWRQLLRQKLKPNGSEAIRLAMAPDFSYATLGVRGIPVFSHDKFNKLDPGPRPIGDPIIMDEDLPPTRDEELVRKHPAPERPGEWQTTITNIIECLNFLDCMKLVVDDWKKGDTKTKKVGKKGKPSRRTAPAAR